MAEDLCERLGEHRGHPVRLMPYALPVAGPSGLWIATAQADYIVYQRETSKAHQDHIIMHEVGHILGDHRHPDGQDGVSRALLPSLSADVVTRALGRTSYDEEQEREAEMTATIIMEWSMLHAVRPRQSTDSSSRIESALGDQQRWL
ncbi:MULTISPECIES: hypothetical protein [Streptomyces]|uniref:hypothetical protein n=1 Tax=Streptomyces TaxID=1883 RepID=UPI001EDC30B8|nr:MULTISPECIES: hypothetical protein [Streptomyces]